MKALVVAAVTGALLVRVVRSRHRRSLHPAGRSFTGELEVWGTARAEGSDLIDRPGRHPAIVRLSKGLGTRGGLADVRGLVVRVPGDRPFDLLLSTSGEGRFTRRLPAPRRTFDALYGSILPYRTGADRKIYLTARPDPGTPLGRDLAGVRSGRVTLYAGDRPFGRVTFDEPLAAAVDAALAFDPIRNTAPDLHPTGTIHSTRAFAYRLSQRWRGVRPAAPAPEAVERTAAHR